MATEKANRWIPVRGSPLVDERPGRERAKLDPYRAGF
jgi:hypothetical protein